MGFHFLFCGIRNQTKFTSWDGNAVYNKYQANQIIVGRVCIMSSMVSRSSGTSFCERSAVYKTKLHRIFHIFLETSGNRFDKSDLRDLRRDLR